MLRHFKRVTKLKQPIQQALARVFIKLIEQAFENHRSWRNTSQRAPYDLWAQAFKPQVAKAIQTWQPKAGYAAGGSAAQFEVQCPSVVVFPRPSRNPTRQQSF
jgi:transposase